MAFFKKIPTDRLFSVWAGWAKKSETGKSIIFNYFEPDESIDLGSPDEIESVMGNFRDGGCQLKFTTTESSAGLAERFTLYLYPRQLMELTVRLWAAYLATEPKQARGDLTALITELKKLSKKSSRTL